MITKKGQGAAPAALIAIIAGLIIIYILLIPPAERESILNDGTISGEGDGGQGYEPTILLSENPGRLDFLVQKTIDHTIPALRIFTRTEAAVLEKSESMIVSRSLFSQQMGNISFTIEDLANTQNLLLSFSAQGRGVLTIILNGERIYSGTGEGVPITLKKRLLQRENLLTFSVSNPGAAFWRANRYTFSNIQVVGDVTSRSAYRSKNTFIISSVEKENLEKIVLRFAADCDETIASPLNIHINDVQIYSAVPDCSGNRIPLEVSPDLINEGENEIEFSVEDGDYYLGFVTLTSELEKIDYPLYYFQIDEQQFRDIRDGARDVLVKLKFSDYSKEKKGELIINGRLISFDTDSVEYEKDISNDIERGNNALKIRPRNTLEVREAIVELTTGEGQSRRSSLDLEEDEDHRVTLRSVTEDNCRSSRADVRLRFEVQERQDLDSFTVQYREHEDDPFDSVTLSESRFKRGGDDDEENSRSGDTYTFFHRDRSIDQWEYRVRANYASGKDPVSASRIIDLDAECPE